MLSLIPEILSLLLDTSYSWVRMLLALAASIVISLAVGIGAARLKTFGKIVVPIIDVLQTLPILAFFPFAIYVVVFILPGIIGINAAVISLIITSMLWNMIFGVYEAIKTLPVELVEMTKLYGVGTFERLKRLYIPASLPRLSEQLSLSWAIGLFYLVTSEIFSTGNANYSVQGIGVDLAQLGTSGNFLYYGIALVIFIGFVVITRLTLFSAFDKMANRYSLVGYDTNKHKSRFNISYRIDHSIMFHKLKQEYTGIKTSISSSVSKHKEFLRKFGYLIAGIVIASVAFLIYSNANPNALSQLGSYEWIAITSLAASFLRVWGAFLLVLAVAIPVSVYVVFMTKRKNSYLLGFQILASIPATVLLPIMVFELRNNGEAVAFMVYFLSGIWYVIFSIIASTKYVKLNIDEVKKIFRVKGLIAWRKIYLLAILPGLITGAVTAIAAEWNASIIAEYFISNSTGAVLTSVGTGIGKLLDTALYSGNLYLMLITLINMTAMIIIFNIVVWRRLYDKVTSVYT